MSAPKVHTTSKTDYFWVNFMENLEEKFSNNFIINFVARNWNPKLITHLWSSNRPDSDKNRLVNLAHLVPWRGFFEVIFWTRKFYRTFKIINFNFWPQFLFGIFRTAFRGDFSNFCEFGDMVEMGWNDCRSRIFWEYSIKGLAQIFSSFVGIRLISPPMKFLINFRIF